MPWLLGLPGGLFGCALHLFHEVHVGCTDNVALFTVSLMVSYLSPRMSTGLQNMGKSQSAGRGVLRCAAGQEMLYETSMR